MTSKNLEDEALTTCRCGSAEDAEADGGQVNFSRLHLAQEYKKFFQAVEASPSCVVITNRDGVIEYVNDRFVVSTGYTREQAIGRKPSLLKSGHTPKHVYETLWTTISAGKIWRGEMCNRKRTGEHYWEATAIAPIVADDGEITHFVAVKEDITERRRAQSDLQRRQECDATLAAITRALLADATTDAVEEALKILATSLGAQRASLFRISGDSTVIADIHEWVADGTAPRRVAFIGAPSERFKWCLDQHRAGKTVAIDNTAKLPKDAGTFKTVLLDGGIQAKLSAPIQLGQNFIGFVDVDMESGQIGRAHV